ncbi:hypothetical protein [Actomonas aquatica]|uniref:EF-hand domain-containing protein n=1 Tax=Actomonas aquatica TaxID=2866162 RepID=A0ABZ1C373_9BACT|nr:hypothetical protein [Opitutus sp. WL0086]WRQ85807.1 hypothetical protein K1X11_013425 [Opitutus sp. WL0086]
MAWATMVWAQTAEINEDRLPPMDTDGDGKVSEAEFFQFVQAGAKVFADAKRDAAASVEQKEAVKRLMSDLPEADLEALVAEVVLPRYETEVEHHSVVNAPRNDALLRRYANGGVSYDEEALTRLLFALQEAPFLLTDLDSDGKLSLPDLAADKKRRNVLLVGTGAAAGLDLFSQDPEGNGKGVVSVLRTELQEQMSRERVARAKKDESEVKEGDWTVEEVYDAFVAKDMFVEIGRRKGGQRQIILRKNGELKISEWLGGDVYNDDAAEISYSRDYKKQDSGTLGLEMALLFPGALFDENAEKGKPTPAWVGAIGSPRALVAFPSLEYQRVSGGNDDIDLATFRLGVGALWVNYDQPGTSRRNVISAAEGLFSMTYSVDRLKRAELLTADFSWRPIVDDIRLGSFQPLGSMWAIQWDLTARGQFRDVMRAGTDEKLAKQSDSMRFGGTLGVKIRPAGKEWERILLAVNYTYLTALWGDPSTTDFLEVDLEYKLRPDLSFILSYDYGAANVVDDEVDMLKLSFGLKL